MIPTRQVPHGLSAQEYLRLSVQYLLLGWTRQMVTAAKKAMELRADLKKFTVHLTYENYEQLGFALGLLENTLEIGDQARDVLEAAKEGFKDAQNRAQDAFDEIEPLGQLRKELKDGWDDFWQKSKRAFDQALEENVYPALGLPSRQVPDHLMSNEYIDLAKQYKKMGWPEQARDAIDKAIEYSSDEETTQRAQRYKKTRIPRLPVPHRAVQMNIKGHEQLAGGEFEAARRTFEEIVREYPEFEWPYGNLGVAYTQLGELEKAEAVLSRVIDINPDYVNAWLHLGRVKAAALEIRQAQSSLDKALRLDPDEQHAIALRQMVDLLASI